MNIVYNNGWERERERDVQKQCHHHRWGCKSKQHQFESYPPNKIGQKDKRVIFSDWHYQNSSAKKWGFCMKNDKDGLQMKPFWVQWIWGDTLRSTLLLLTCHQLSQPPPIPLPSLSPPRLVQRIPQNARNAIMQERQRNTKLDRVGKENRKVFFLGKIILVIFYKFFRYPCVFINYNYALKWTKNNFSAEIFIEILIFNV